MGVKMIGDIVGGELIRMLYAGACLEKAELIAGSEHNHVDDRKYKVSFLGVKGLDTFTEIEESHRKAARLS